ncbi:MAG: extracellular solute-binding protein [Lachnospiraceae bacterium]|uniref:Extracellular solute-binding protein n=1 Tax=Candidatus Weimeria bifida TaxID=2599074 RepID=A0A6N7IYV5_9FIRM|nr:extracellular solute-binding protein [Candidatus Weimeria bifida]RRF97189.1 MAG: extracellular solute-binding protein [Lachnospiraceae bacterium]
MKKRIVSLLLAASMVATLGACGNSSNASKSSSSSSAKASSNASKADPVQNLIKNTKGSVDLTLWVSETSQYQKVMKEIVNNFKNKYKNVKLNITIGSESEANTKDDLLKDPEAGADVFAFADDQINDLVKKGVLQEVSTTYTYDPKSVDTDTAVTASTLNNKLYAYPMTASNGYFLYYNKDVVPDADAGSLDKILADCEKANKTFGMELSNAWYLYSFFKGAGLKATLKDDGTTECDWNSKTSNPTGAKVAEAITKAAKSKAFKNLGNDDQMSAVKDGKMAACVNGTWSSDAVQKAWGDKMGAAKLPTYTVDGKQVQMGSFSGCKLIGVNAYSKQTGWAMLLAEYITNPENQMKIFKATGEAPATKEGQASSDVKSSKALNAIIAQSKFSAPQRVGANFWNSANSLGQSLAEGKYSDAQKLLDDAVKGITAAVK